MKFTINCTGDVVTGDIIEFTESVFGGSYRKPRYLGDRTIQAIVLKDSYGSAKQQHTFKLEILACSGIDPIEPGKTIRRKGRNVYRNGTKRCPWEPGTNRTAVATEKHQRGDQARKARDCRYENEINFD